MNHRFFIKFTLALTVIIVFTSLILSNFYDLTLPRDPGPQLNLSVRMNYLRYLEKYHPDIVILGDSTLARGVDASLLVEQTDKSVYKISIHGSASALWYLVLKNNISISSYKPSYVIILFRDSILTVPEYRVQGSYFDLVTEYAQVNDSLFIENSFVNLMSPLEKSAESFFPLYISRYSIRKKIDHSLRYFAPTLIGCDQSCTDIALSELFFASDLEPGALADAVGSAEELLYTDEQLDFDAQVDSSYLPEMIRIAKENNIELIFVRIKVETSYLGPELTQYLNSLETYFAENDVTYLDFGNDNRLSHEFFMDGIHLNEQGMNLFTELLAKELMELWVTK